MRLVESNAEKVVTSTEGDGVLDFQGDVNCTIEDIAKSVRGLSRDSSYKAPTQFRLVSFTSLEDIRRSHEFLATATSIDHQDDPDPGPIAA